MSDREEDGVKRCASLVDTDGGDRKKVLSQKKKTDAMQMTLNVEFAT